MTFLRNVTLPSWNLATAIDLWNSSLQWVYPVIGWEYRKQLLGSFLGINFPFILLQGKPGDSGPSKGRKMLLEGSAEVYKWLISDICLIPPSTSRVQTILSRLN